MKVVVAEEISGGDSVVRGIKVAFKHFFDDDAPDGLNFRMGRSDFLASEETYTTPRHRHAFQQVRWAEVGTLNFAPGQDLYEGDVGYFPKASYYGPQAKDSGISVAVQFGLNGECQYGGDRKAERAAAMERLKTKGISANGIFTDVDPETGTSRERDAVQAIDEEQFEAATGRKFAFPPTCYDGAIQMHPDAFSYYEIEPGVELKLLGRFFDHPGPNGDVRISMIRLGQGGVFHLGAERAQIAWAKAAGLRVEGTTYPELTFLYSPRDEEVDLSSETTTEINYLEFPRLD